MRKIETEAQNSKLIIIDGKRGVGKTRFLKSYKKNRNNRNVLEEIPRKGDLNVTLTRLNNGLNNLNNLKTLFKILFTLFILPVIGILLLMVWIGWHATFLALIIPFIVYMIKLVIGMGKERKTNSEDIIGDTINNINKHCQWGRKSCIILDQVEHINEKFLKDLKDFIDRFIGKCENALLIVILPHKDLICTTKMTLNNTYSLHIENFDEDEIKTYFNRNKINNTYLEPLRKRYRGHPALTDRAVSKKKYLTLEKLKSEDLQEWEKVYFGSLWNDLSENIKGLLEILSICQFICGDSVNREGIIQMSRYIFHQPVRIRDPFNPKRTTEAKFQIENSINPDNLDNLVDELEKLGFIEGNSDYFSLFPPLFDKFCLGKEVFVRFPTRRFRRKIKDFKGQNEREFIESIKRKYSKSLRICCNIH